MSSENQNSSTAIQFVIGLSLRGPIKPGDYQINNASINVSYPDKISIGLPTPIFLPDGISTLFIVSWTDGTGKTSEQLEGHSYHRNLPVHDALLLISNFLMTFKLMRVGHADGMRVRTVGISDTLFYYSLVDGQPTGGINIGLRLEAWKYPWADVGVDPWDRHGSTELALPHIGGDTFPIARRFIRCFELIEHGFFKEAVIIAHTILDDTVQAAIREQLTSKGIPDRKSQDSLLRAIKEERLGIYLGSLLKIVAGVSICEIWSDAPKAIAWLNTARNKIAHAGSGDSRASAAKAIFVSTKTIAALRSRGILSCEFPAGMLRTARLTAAWTENPEAWVPSGEAIESDPFD